MESLVLAVAGAQCANTTQMAGTEIDACDVLQLTDPHQKQERSFLSFFVYPSIALQLLFGSHSHNLHSLAILFGLVVMSHGYPQVVPIDSELFLF